jgi:uncharacterized membrane protein
MPSHCNNNTKDSTETSIDCGGECGCSATFSIITQSGAPADSAGGVNLEAMSGDGNTLVGSMPRGRSNYPAKVSATGAVTELSAFGTIGSARGVSSDGSVIVGSINCSDPPTCSTTAERAFRWQNGGTPTAVHASGTGLATSATGAIIAGTSYQNNVAGFFLAQSGGSSHYSELTWVKDLSADGKFVAGTPPTGNHELLLSLPARSTVSLSRPSTWTNSYIHGLNQDGSVMIGYGYDGSNSVGYVWKSNSYTQLTRSGATSVIPNAVNADGTVVVGVINTGVNQDAFIWTSSDGLQLLKDVLAERGIEIPSDVVLANARFVSDDGKTVVGLLRNGAAWSFWRVVFED